MKRLLLALMIVAAFAFAANAGAPPAPPLGTGVVAGWGMTVVDCIGNDVDG